jgi:hypothetical protein
MCDTFATIGPRGALFAKNSDRSPTEAQVVEWHPARPAAATLATQYLRIADAPAHGVVLSRPTWLFGAEHGVNEHGLVIGNERVYSRRDLSGPAALIGMDLVRLTLERAHDVDEGLEVLTALLERHGQGGSGDRDHDDPYDSSFLLCDAGGGWVVETSGRDWAAEPFTERAAISNRYTVDARWTRASSTMAPGASVDDWHEPTVDTRLADHRLAATTACTLGDPDPAGAVATLRHHGTVPWGAPGRHQPPVPPPAELGDDLSGITVCMHIPDFQATTAAMVCELPIDDGPLRVWACLGAPCVGVFVPFVVPVVPEFLGDVAQWQRSTALRDRVDADHDALATIRAVLDPLELELWQEADELVDASPGLAGGTTRGATDGSTGGANDGSWEQFGASCGARIEQAFTDLGV